MWIPCERRNPSYIGAENWPSPIPLARKSAAWYFDTAAGKREILYRRVGENELAVIRVCRELVSAEKEYEAQSRDGAPRQFAQKFFSAAGRHDGLYWPASSGQPQSPIGPLVAKASGEGYNLAGGQKPQPFHGYYFRLLTGSKTAGAAKSYVVDGKMTGGFAFVAWPADYRVSGVVTFLVDQGGVVYQKDLGRDTARLAQALKEYNRDATWRKAD